MTLNELIESMTEGEKSLPLEIEFENFHGVVAHLKLKETGNMNETKDLIQKCYGDCDVTEYGINYNGIGPEAYVIRLCRKKK